MMIRLIGWWISCSNMQSHDIKTIPLGDSAKPRILEMLRSRDAQKHRVIDLLFEELRYVVEKNKTKLILT